MADLLTFPSSVSFLESSNHCAYLATCKPSLEVKSVHVNDSCQLHKLNGTVRI